MSDETVTKCKANPCRLEERIAVLQKLSDIALSAELADDDDHFRQATALLKSLTAKWSLDIHPCETN